MSEKFKSIELSLREPIGISRDRCPITLGVPFPQGQLKDVKQIQLAIEDREIPFQVRPTCHWLDDSTKWILLDFQVDLKPAIDQRVVLYFGGNISSSAKCKHPIQLTQSPESVQVDTGPLQFEVIDNNSLPISHLRYKDFDVLPSGSISNTLEVDGNFYQLVVQGKPVIEESGPMRVVICSNGIGVSSEGKKSFDVTARVYAYAGHSFLRIYLTLANLIPKKLVHFKSWKFSLNPKFKDKPEGFLLSSVATGHHAYIDPLIQGSRTLRVDIEDAPFPPWKEERQEFMKETPYRVKRAKENCVVIPGNRQESEQRPGGDWLLGAGVLYDSEFTATFALRNMWRNAPKELTVNTDGFNLLLYPDWCEPLEWYRGVAKTHELILNFSEGIPDKEECLSFICGFQKPVIPQVATRNWIVNSGAFGPLLRYQPQKYPWWEYIFRAIAGCQIWKSEKDFAQGATMIDFGDRWSTGRGGAWNNNEMDKGYGLIIQMVRSGYPKIMEAIEPIIMHQIDVDTIYDSEEKWQIGGQRYHFAKHGWMLGPFLCHEWLEGPLFYYLLTGYKRAKEIALARAHHLCKAVDLGKHRVKTLARVSGYPLMALSRMQEYFPDESYIEACEKILDWLEQWYSEEGGILWEMFTPPGKEKCASALARGVLCNALMRYHRLTKSKRAYKLLKQITDDALGKDRMFTPEGFMLKTTSLFRNYMAPEPDFFFEALAYLSQKEGNLKYIKIAYLNMERLLVARDLMHLKSERANPVLYRYWIPFLAYADKAGILKDLRPC